MKNQKPKKIKIKYTCNNCAYTNIVAVASDWDMVNFACVWCDEDITLHNWNEDKNDPDIMFGKHKK